MSSNDPISTVNLRLATLDESKEARGYSFWNTVSAPWNFTCKVIGTINLSFAGANILKWRRTWLQGVVDKVCHAVGLKPEEAFMSSSYAYFVGNWHWMHSSTKILKTVLHYHRNEELFANSLTMEKFLTLLEVIFPEEKFTQEDFMMTCSQKNTSLYRKVLGRALSYTKVKKYASQIRSQACERLKKWEKSEVINVTEEMRLFTSSVITGLVLEDDFSSEEISTFIDTLNHYTIQQIRKKATESDKLDFTNNAKTFREIVLKILENETLPLFSETELSSAQKKALIFMVFFAGQETTATSLTWIILSIARSEQVQENLYDYFTNEFNFTDSFKQILNTSLAEFPPAYRIGRKAKKDLCLEYELVGEDTKRKKIILAGEFIIADIIGRSQIELQSGNKFFSGNKFLNYQDWLPFGSGAHACPGELLANEEIMQFVKALILNYTITTKQIGEIPKEGFVTLKLAEDVYIEIKPRIIN